jgi:hypothetical protein
MKLKIEPIQIDLYVSNKKITEREFKELAEFIEQVKRNKKLAKKRHRKVA